MTPSRPAPEAVERMLCEIRRRAATPPSRVPLLAALGVALAGAATAAILLLPGAGDDAPAPSAAFARVLASEGGCTASAGDTLGEVTRIACTPAGRVRLAVGGADVRLDGAGALTVRREVIELDWGRLSVATRGRAAPEIRTPRHVVLDRGTRFVLEQGAIDLSAEVSEGTIEIWQGARRVATLGRGERWTSRPPERSRARVAVPQESAPAPAGRPRVAPPPVAPTRVAPPPSALAAPAPSPPPPAAPAGRDEPRPSSDLERELAAFDAARALARAGRFDEARAAWRAYRTGFAGGSLAEEADVELLDACVRMGDLDAARREAQRFLDEHPSSPRAAEVRALRDRLR